MIIPGSYWLTNRSYFIKKDINALERNILTLSEEHISNRLKDIYKLTQTEFFEISILNKLLKRIQKKKKCYYRKQYTLYDWSALPSAIITLLLLSITLISYDYICSYYDWSEKNTLVVISILVFIFTFYMIKKIYISLHQWYHPNHKEYKEYYEKFSFIEKKLQHKINNLRKKHDSKN
jgi:hypothetical protein